jgi:L-alanine-DL-glutamate epimerase-like enolase superfamily enzyme
MRVESLSILRVRGSYVAGPEVAAGACAPPGGGGEAIEADFLQVRGSGGQVGLFGPVGSHQSYFLLGSLRERVVGADVFAYERLWHEVYNAERHGRSGHYVLALSALDCALWDLRGKARGASVMELLGGPVPERIPAYASLLGFDPDGEGAAQLARRVRDEGYAGQKWALRDTPLEGEGGLRRNVERVARLREAVGPYHSLSFDALGKWRVGYTLEFCRRVGPFNIAWLEEPLPPGSAASYARLRSCGLPIAAGEHAYTRHEAFDLLDTGGISILQPDLVWCGGITEGLKISALCSARDVPLCPHGNGLIPALQLAGALPARAVPMVEYHLTVEPKRQFFLKRKFTPAGGCFDLPRASGMGIELDYSRVEQMEELTDVGFVRRVLSGDAGRAASPAE